MKYSSKTTEKTCSCPVESRTTHREHFLRYEKIVAPILAKLQEPTDIELISGHIGNNLQFNNQPIKSKVWPEMLKHVENYEDFLKHLEYYKKGLYDIYFKCPTLDKKIINEMFKKLNKSAYQLIYSTEIFTPCAEKRRFAKLESQPVRMKYEETTYRTYFSRIKELERFKETLHGMANMKNKESLKNNLKTILHCGRSTYHEEMSVLGKLYAKPTLPGPIDRYTLRKI